MVDTSPLNAFWEVSQQKAVAAPYQEVASNNWRDILIFSLPKCDSSAICREVIANLCDAKASQLESILNIAVSL